MKKISKPNHYWKYDKCREEALKYNRRVDFRKNSSGAYSAARLNNWLSQICLHMVRFSNPQGYWTKEKCHEIALTCNTRHEFRLKSGGAYSAAHKKKWLDDICAHMKRVGNRYLRCIYSYEFSDNHVYIGLTYDMTKRDYRRKLNKFDQVTKHIKLTNLTPIIKQLTEYLPINEASELERHYVEEYKTNGWQVLNKKKAGDVGGRNNIWSFESVKEVALKHKKRNDFSKNERGAYGVACENKWLDTICGHMTEGNKPKNYWTYELCNIEALKCKTRTEFRLSSRMAYEASLNNGWIDDYFPKIK
jgi:predicted GIY-YIG superfamily endonuclease